MSKKSGGFRMSMDEFRRRFPKEAAELDRREASRSRGATSPLASSDARQSRTPFNAKPTQAVWVDGTVVNFPSKTEARVAERLVREHLATPGSRLYRQVPVPLLSIEHRRDATGHGIPYKLTVDFVFVRPDGTERWVDAKTRRKNREWARGRAAAEAWLGQPIEEVDA